MMLRADVVREKNFAVIARRYEARGSLKDLIFAVRPRPPRTARHRRLTGTAECPSPLTHPTRRAVGLLQSTPSDPYPKKYFGRSAGRPLDAMVARTYGRQILEVRPLDGLTRAGRLGST